MLRDRNALYRQSADGSVANDYTLKLINKSTETRRYRITIQSEAPLRLDSPSEISAGPEQMVPVAVSVVADGDTSGRHDLRFVVEPVDGSEQRIIDSSFFGPVQ